MKIYLIGSLRNPQVPLLAERIRKETDHEVFDDWYAAGPEADDYWRDYEKARGHGMTEALKGYAAGHVYEYDRHHLDTSSAGILLLPAGKSGHIEAGYLIGCGKPVFALYEQEPDRFDVMYKFFTGVFTDTDKLLDRLRELEQKSLSFVHGFVPWSE